MHDIQQKKFSNEFSKQAEQLINIIAESIEQQDNEGILDIDLHLGEMLNIITPDGQYVINKHSAAQEVWLSSPQTGAYHFSYQALKSQWIDSKGTEIINLLQQELSVFLPNLHLDI